MFFTFMKLPNDNSNKITISQSDKSPKNGDGFFFLLSFPVVPNSKRGAFLSKKQCTGICQNIACPYKQVESPSLLFLGTTLPSFSHEVTKSEAVENNPILQTRRPNFFNFRIKFFRIFTLHPPIVPKRALKLSKGNIDTFT
jgi:hypothetical protein